LWEEQAALFFAREQERLAAAIPDASLKVYPESNHAVHWERTDQIVVQYDKYEPLDGVLEKGNLTLGENIGDLGGVLVAYDGLQKHLDQHDRPDEIDGFTPEQRFFISWATVWRTKSRDEALRTQVQTDPHSPAQYRANGPLVNVDAIHEAFVINEGDRMFVAPEDRVRIW
jgi:putative endopeptidase